MPGRWRSASREGLGLTFAKRQLQDDLAIVYFAVWPEAETSIELFGTVEPGNVREFQLCEEPLGANVRDDLQEAFLPMPLP